MADNEIVITPAEYGNVITTTKLSNLQSGGRTDVGAAALVGRNAGRSQDAIAMLALDAGSGTTITPGGTAVASLVATDVCDAAFMEDAYHELAKNSIPMIGDQYVMVAHDAVISDLREDAAASGGWTDVNKYGQADRVLKNEVGMYKGFRIIRQNDATLTADAGAGAVDVYNSYFLGFNALGKAVSNPASLTITGPYDKLNRFLNIGWYGAFGYTVVESSAAILGRCAATRGVNV
jgi:N4-gp56 family major capsid protein